MLADPTGLTGMPQEGPVLDVRDLTIRFAGQSLNLVEGVTFSIDAGRTLCLVGEIGCGKSVTSLAIMGLLPEKAGKVQAEATRFSGRDLLSMKRSEREALRGDDMAMIFQEPMTSLNPVFTVGHQVAEAVRRHRRCSKADARNVPPGAHSGA